jgi:UDP-4-amino-4,6-dideoxy-N-acetyl-beta-L-altrosamine N-acetyltransferase
MINYIHINKKKFVLKKFEDLCDDESNFALKIRNHPDVRSQMYNSNVIDKNEHLKFIKSLLGKEDTKYFLVFANEVAIGVINFKSIDCKLKKCEFGIYANLDSDYPKKGYLLISVAKKYALTALELKEIYLEVYAENVKALNLYKKNGFTNYKSIFKKKNEIITMKCDLVNETII